MVWTKFVLDGKKMPSVWIPYEPSFLRAVVPLGVGTMTMTQVGQVRWPVSVSPDHWSASLDVVQ